MRSASSHIFSTILIILGVAALGCVMAVIIANRIDHSQRDHLLVEAKQAALLVSSEDISSLSGTEADLSNPVYLRLKTKLTQFREANPDIRFVYVMGYKPEVRMQFFYVDSEPVTSADYSPPGQLYGNTREEDIKNYLAGVPYSDGPYKDSWGEWVSGYVPLTNEQGAVIGMVGVDIATSIWHSQIKFTRIMIAIIAVLLSIIIIFISGYLYRGLRSIGILSSRNRELEVKHGTLKHMQQLAQVGTFVLHFPDGEIVIDEQFSPLFRSSRMDKETFRSFIHIDDQEKFEAMVKEIATSSIVYSWVDLRIGTTEAGFRTYHIYGNIERHASGPAERFDGVIQDITDIK
jgi:hypothetical protein